MESNRLFASPNEEKFINVYINATLCEKRGDHLVPLKDLGRMKNPDTVCFSHSGKLIAIKNNNGLIEIYDSTSGHRIFKTKGPKKFGGRMYFLGEKMLLSSTEDGIIYAQDVSNDTMLFSQNIQLNNVDIVNLSEDSFLVLGNDEDSGTTKIHLLSVHTNKADMVLLEQVPAMLDTEVASYIDGKLYALSKDNMLFIFAFDADNTALLLESTIVLRNSETSKFSEKASFFKRLAAMGFNTTPSVFPVAIVKLPEDQILLAYNLGGIVFDTKKKTCMQSIPFVFGITSVLSINEGRQLWFSTGEGVRCISSNDILT